MAQDFPGLPENIYEYENRFNYSVWTPNTTILMCNVPWDSSYRDVVRFDSDKERDAYFASRSSDGYAFTLNGLVYLRYGEPVRVNAPFDMVTRCNYMVVKNPLQPVPPTEGRQPDVFYYFINDAKYLAPNTTQLNVQLDVWMTYYNRIEFNMCYVNKGHIGIANENSTIYNLSEYMTDPEGLNIGDEYDIVDLVIDNFLDKTPYIVIMSNADLTSDFGDVSNPSLKTATGSINDGMPSGASAYACDSQNFLKLMEALQNAPWVSQCISMITVVPDRFVQLGDKATVEGVELYKLKTDPAEDITGVRVDSVLSKFHIPDRYKNLLKFYTSPYCVVEMTAYNGGEVILKPECFTINPTWDSIQITTGTVLAPPDIRGYSFISGYNSAKDIVGVEAPYYLPSGDSFPHYEYTQEELDIAVQFNNFPQFSLVNNQYIYYLASNRNTLAYQFAAAEWTQQKALTAAQLSFNQSGANMQNAWANQQVANQANWALSNISQEKNLWGGVSSGISSGVGALGNLASGNVGGAAADVANIGLAAANTALNADWINRTTATQVGAATQTTQNNIGLQGYMRDTNYDYAVYAANGDYETAIQGIQAKVQDARLKQPSTSGQNGGDAFNFCKGYMGIRLKFKRLKMNFVRQIGDFWLRYGYYVNRWITPPADLKCMEHFTYWKMQSVALSTTEVPELFKETIRGIFEKGVTVWSDPDLMYKIDLADNEPVEGVRY